MPKITDGTELSLYKVTQGTDISYSVGMTLEDAISWYSDTSAIEKVKYVWVVYVSDYILNANQKWNL